MLGKLGSLIPLLMVIIMIFGLIQMIHQYGFSQMMEVLILPLILERHGLLSLINLLQRYIKWRLMISIHIGYMVVSKIIIQQYLYLVYLLMGFRLDQMLILQIQEDAKQDLRFQNLEIQILSTQTVKAGLVFTIK